MHEHLFGIIAAAADGTASPEEAVLVERAVAECDACAEELRAQTEILEILKAAPPVSMTELERASLHRSLATATQPAQSPGWYRRYAPRIAAVAAGFAVVGLASVAMLGRLGSDTAEMSDAVSAESADETSATDAAEAPMVGDEGFLQDFEDASTEPTMAASADAVVTEEMAGDGGRDDMAFHRLAILPDDLDALLAGEVPVELTEQLDFAIESFVAVCPDLAPDPELTELAAQVTFEDEAAYVLVYSSESERLASVVAVPSCEVLAEATDAP